MASIDYAGCELRLKAHEGGEYTDGVHPYDPGGPTRWGITLTDARLYWEPSATAEDVRAMPWAVAQGIYRNKYWARQGCDDLPGGVDYVTFDYGVHSGIARSGKVLRRVMGLSDADWHTTSDVWAAARERNANALVDAICDERMQFLRGLPIWPTYKGGWTTRVTEVRAYAHELAENPSLQPPLPAPTAIPSTQMAKGMHNPPVAAKKIVTHGGGALVLGSGGFLNWMGAHPFESGVGMLAGAAIVGVAFVELDRRYQAKQEAPSIGTIPVPEIAAK